MAPIRLRYPRGITTIQVDFDAFTVQDLMQEVYAVSEIPPSLQELRAGYPPHSLTLVPELPLASLGISQGEQLIVHQKQVGGVIPNSPPKPTHIPRTNIPTAPGVASRSDALIGPESAYSTSTSSADTTDGRPDVVEIDGGFLVHRIVPDDNSCLFSCVALIFTQDIGNAQRIRQIVADGIINDTVTWTEAILGRPRDDYISTILNPTSWGGAIELTILANYYGVEIASIDVETGRIDHFTPNGRINCGKRCMLIYSGIHYDAASLSPMEDAPPEFHQTIMSVTSNDPRTDPVLDAAQKLADKLRQKRAYTNTATFSLKCEDCGQGLIGEREARMHASQTGHFRFGEY